MVSHPKWLQQLREVRSEKMAVTKWDAASRNPARKCISRLLHRVLLPFFVTHPQTKLFHARDVQKF